VPHQLGSLPQMRVSLCPPTQRLLLLSPPPQLFALVLIQCVACARRPP